MAGQEKSEEICATLQPPLMFYFRLIRLQMDGKSKLVSNYMMSIVS